ncbi:hypothetical protein KUL42_25540 [Alteromonas sp. KUL42]|uniref:hypothetical protein n=1 Tax=Alteromonas sp. KUL42 TaxID=2480797 RepID=UPI0007924C74|nr:hypothetical protein [Alteromonas sp. KUL42]KXJ59922.1 MAG: hypothetical protein AXW14_01200 [Alteromonas sp. Nap_26]TAP34392.1 hypothetical protein EYR97_12605 [Alteromonas sp. KUL42]GEA07793.1 hypothetical protein KUL42_25540 [Alteromonas sp. KUL42]
MKKHLLTLKVALVLMAAPLSFMASADDHVEMDTESFSTEAYCLLQKEGVDPRYLKVYAEKLGAKPTRKICRAFEEFAEEVTPKDWDYPQGRPYPGSVIRLTQSQIDKIKAARNEN